jgi:hypothetical protein
METPTRYIITSKSGTITVSGDYSTCTCWFATITTVFHVLIPSTMCPKQENLYPAIVDAKLSTPFQKCSCYRRRTCHHYAASQTKNSARTALAGLNSVLASLSITAQRFPLSVMLGCVNMLRNLKSRWKSNETAVLVEGNIIFQLYSNNICHVYWTFSWK